MRRTRRKLLTHWHGIDKDGAAVSGWSLVDDDETLMQQLAFESITLLRTQKRPIPLFKTADAYHFLEQISSLLKAGMPILEAIELTRQDEIPRRSEMILSGLLENLKSGLSLSASSAPFIKKNDGIILQAMVLGEKSGKFDEVLERLLSQRQKNTRMRAQLTQAAIYPLVLTVLSTVIIMLMMIWAVPQFKSIYADFGAQLPAYTQNVIAASEFLVANGSILGLSLLLFVITMMIMKNISPLCARIFAHAQLRLPLIGYFFRVRLYRQFATDLNLVYRSGMPLGEALSWLPSTSDHLRYRTVLKRVCENLSHGMSLNESLKTCDFFPPFLIQTVKVGENSGSLDRAFERIEQFYDDALTNTADKLIKLVEPLLIVILASIIGLLLVAMYLPMFNLGVVL